MSICAPGHVYLFLTYYSITMCWMYSAKRLSVVCTTSLNNFGLDVLLANGKCSASLYPIRGHQNLRRT
ncbi:hypothetical protein BDZ94DRAFT_1276000 [Collybia nuda]|uniref:Uncharacterized protein n=1 Tax=Collybia nuda TaxID=64659 RepID=A0A9P6CCQ5_9AGAR|nr:hypothetical protein BDZ94DRAFT_1276000 [Collybia nuda]